MERILWKTVERILWKTLEWARQ